MSEACQKPNPTTPESYSPKERPEIISLAEDARQIEKPVQTINYKNVEFEVVRRLDVIWAGCVDYAANNTDESNIGSTLKRFQELVETAPIKEKVNPDWSASLSINYNCSDKPCGIMFANESYTDQQDERYDIFTQPGGLWLRVKGDDKNAKVLLGKDKAQLYEFFEPLRNAAKENGYTQNPDVPVEVEYHCHAEYKTPPHTCYAYIPVIESPEGYSPKERPAILELADSMELKNAAPKAAAATIANEERNTVRIVELPACKMVTSGPANGPDIFGPDGVMTRFNNWFSEYDKNRKDKFYPRDFMWSPAEGGFEWGYAVGEVPKDTGGFEVIDFPGGLYAVAISVDADGKDHDRVYKGIQEWVEKSGCFMLDETEKRRSLGNVTSPPMAKEAMGYHQMDLYFPIRIQEESK